MHFWYTHRASMKGQSLKGPSDFLGSPLFRDEEAFKTSKEEAVTEVISASHKPNIDSKPRLPESNFHICFPKTILILEYHLYLPVSHNHTCLRYLFPY